MMYYVYILKSVKDGSHYIGYSANVEKRLNQHNSGMSTYSRRKMPWKVVLFEKYKTKSEAIKREKKIKSFKGGIQFKRLVERQRSTNINIKS